MLSKLLKYELRASGRILLPVYALLLASAGCCSLFYKLAADHPYRTGAASLLDGTRFLVIDSIETLVACGVFYTLTWYNLQKRLNLQ